MSSDRMNRYWLPNVEINKKVITQELQYYLGPDSHVRPYTKDGEDGFLISTPGECLTDEQIDDICRKSKEVWEKQAAARSKKDADKSDRADKPLKRPLHQPVLLSRAAVPLDAGRRQRPEQDRRGRTSDERRRDRDSDVDRWRCDDDRRDDARRSDWRRDNRRL